jgi:hypothetical protein
MLVLPKSTKQGEFLSACVCILQSATMHLPLHRFINTELGNIVHEGRYGRGFAILDDVFVVPFKFLFVVRRTAWKHKSLRVF